MIDEQQHDLAIEYIFGQLEGDAQKEFEAWLQSDAEMRTVVDELRETTAAVALSAPQHLPPPHLRAKVLAISRGETSTPSASSPTFLRRLGWLPWAIAAGLAITGIVLQIDRARWRREATNARAEVERSLAAAASARDRVSKSNGSLQLAEVQAKTYLDQITEFRNEIVKLRGRDALAQMRISALTAQVAQYADAGAIVVWDSEEQRGVVKLANLPKPAAGKDYQLWVVDPKYPTPVSGGVLTVDDSGQASINFRAAQLIEHADKFAISVEQAGGVANAAGPVIFAGE